jgi:histidine ammonia-lyase
LKVDQSDWSIEDILQIAQEREPLKMGDRPWRLKIQKGADFLNRYLSKHENVYGVTTGYGDSCKIKIPRELIEQLPLHLIRFHGCGLGRYFSETQIRAIMAVRLASLKRGYSGVRPLLLEKIIEFLNHNILPQIPEEGSVGASGDLTPLSYLAAALVGEREVLFRKRIMSAKQALKKCGLTPLTLKPKEGLAIMNGTAVMTALACFAWKKAEYLTRLSSRCTALLVEVVQGNKNHFRADLFDVKPFKGQSECASWIYSDIGDHKTKPIHQLQDRYSLRCAPHVIGVLRDALPWMKEHIETEINSTNDNPIIDAEKGEILHGGHFYGGHIAFVMDAMKNAVANLADLQDRQIALMTDMNSNNGLPANLSGAKGARAAINHGFKAVQIGVSAWTAEALKLTMPASAFSRSTECHNQDKVSMGTIAARDCLRVIELTQQVCAATMLACVQGIELRKKKGDILETQLTPATSRFCADVRKLSAFVDSDRPLDKDLRKIIELINAEHWSLYPL